MELILIGIIAFILWNQSRAASAENQPFPEIKPGIRADKPAEDTIIGNVIIPPTVTESVQEEKPTAPVIIPDIIAESFGLSPEAAGNNTLSAPTVNNPAPNYTLTAQTEYNPLLPWWTKHTEPYQGWGFCDMYADINVNDIPEFRRQRIYAFMLWLGCNYNCLSSETKAMAYSYLMNTRKFAQYWDILRSDRVLKNWCIDNNTSMESEIWQFEKAGGFGPVDIGDLLPREIGVSGRLVWDTHETYAYNTGWLVFGINYNRDATALMAAFEADLIINNGSLESALYGKQPIWIQYNANTKPLTPIYNRDLNAYNNTIDLEQHFQPKDNEIHFFDALRQIPGALAWAQNKNLFAVEVKNYISSINALGADEGHNAWFKLHFPEHWLLVARRTPEVNAMAIKNMEDHIAAYNAYNQSIIDRYYANPAGISGDLALEIINAKSDWYNLLINTEGGLTWPDPNERIKRFIKAVIGRDQYAYQLQLKSRNERFWDKLIEWERNNPFTPEHKLVMDSETGQLTRKWQTNTDYFAYRVPTSGYILGRFYVDEPGNCYMYDNQGNKLYDIQQYGRIVDPNTLISGKHGKYYELKT